MSLEPAIVKTESSDKSGTKRLAFWTELLREVMDMHSDPNAPEYNGCDKRKCFWCEQADAQIAINASLNEWLYFHCVDCEHRWKLPSRDAAWPSGDKCPRCGEWCHPYDST